MAYRTKQEEIEALRADVSRLQVFERLWLLQNGKPQPEMVHRFKAEHHTARARDVFVHVYGVGTTQEIAEVSEREAGHSYKPVMQRPQRFDDLLKSWGGSHMADYRRAVQDLRAKHKALIAQLERCDVQGHAMDNQGLCHSCGVVLNMELAEVAACERFEPIRLREPAVVS